MAQLLCCCCPKSRTSCYIRRTYICNLGWCLSLDCPLATHKHLCKTAIVLKVLQKQTTTNVRGLCQAAQEYAPPALPCLSELIHAVVAEAGRVMLTGRLPQRTTPARALEGPTHTHVVQYQCPTLATKSWPDSPSLADAPALCMQTACHTRPLSVSSPPLTHSAP